MPIQTPTNFNELSEKTLDDKNNVLNRQEKKALNDVDMKSYESMKDDIANKQVTRKGEDIKLSDFVNKIWVDGKVRMNENEKWEPLEQGSELAAWVQIFLVSQGVSVATQNHKTLWIDGIVWWDTRRALVDYHQNKRIQDNKDKIEDNKDKIDEKVLSDINQRLQWATEYSKDWDNPINVNIIDKNKPFVVSVENYGKSTIVDLEQWLMTFDGIEFPWFTDRKMDMVDWSINIKNTSDDNQELLEHVYKQAGLLNYIFWKLVPEEKGNARSNNPFYFGWANIWTSEAWINFDNGIIRDKDVISIDANYQWSKYDQKWEKRNGMGIDHDKFHQEIPDILNTIYKKYI